MSPWVIIGIVWLFAILVTPILAALVYVSVGALVRLILDGADSQYAPRFLPPPPPRPPPPRR